MEMMRHVSLIEKEEEIQTVVHYNGLMISKRIALSYLAVNKLYKEM